MVPRQETAIRRIALMGPESTGKTSLAQALAEHFGTVWVPEFLRGYYEKRGGRLEAADSLRIVAGQLAAEAELLPRARGLLICDTCPLQTLVYHRKYFGDAGKDLMQAVEAAHYDYYLLLVPDIAWVADPQREGDGVRQELFPRMQEELEGRGLPFGLVRGEGEARLARALALISVFMGGE